MCDNCGESGSSRLQRTRHKKGVIGLKGRVRVRIARCKQSAMDEGERTVIAFWARDRLGARIALGKMR